MSCSISLSLSLSLFIIFYFSNFRYGLGQIDALEYEGSGYYEYEDAGDMGGFGEYETGSLSDKGDVKWIASGKCTGNAFQVTAPNGFSLTDFNECAEQIYDNFSNDCGSFFVFHKVYNTCICCKKQAGALDYEKDASSDYGVYETFKKITPAPTDPTLSPTKANAHCTNGVKDDDESDIDCGGADCDPCKDGQFCNSMLDCESYTNGGACSTGGEITKAHASPKLRPARVPNAYFHSNILARRIRGASVRIQGYLVGNGATPM